MEKQTKNTITREHIEKELRFYNTADIKSSLVLCGVFTLMLFMCFGFLCAVLSMIEERLFKSLLILLFCGVLSIPLWYYLFVILKALSKQKMVKRGDFDIVTREVLYKREKPVQRHTEEFLYFQDFKEASVGHTTYQLASQGDLFYIVHYKSSSHIELLYSHNMYEYK